MILPRRHGHEWRQPTQRLVAQPTRKPLAISAKGHGRIGQAGYTTAINIPVALNIFQAGNECPGRCGGASVSA